MRTFLFIIFGLIAINANAQTDLQQIQETLMNYIDGTANGEPEKLRKAFHPDFNLYSVNKADSLNIWLGKDYINGVKKGVKANRIGRIISIDFEKNAAMVKVEILIPNWRVYTDYFLLLKYEGTWKIIHKSYSWQELQSVEKK